MIKLPELNSKFVIDNLCSFIVKEMQKTGFSKAVLGLSGGIDSALVAALASKSLGSKNVTGILMPYRTSNKSSIDDAMKVVEFLKINHELIEISNAVDIIAEKNMINPTHQKKTRMGNVMARIRMITLFDFSSAEDAIVFGTGNKSEIELGYFTLFGDGASAINPIGNIYKSDVFSLSKYLGIPESIINKAPSADLFEGQTDETEIGFAYKDMDPVIYGLTDLKLQTHSIIDQGHDELLVNFINKRINIMSYKRRIPLVAKL